MVYVDDVVSAFFAACERPEAVGEGMIVAGPRPCTLRELIEEVRRATGSRRFGRRLPLAPMLAAAAVVEDVCQALHLDPPIYRRRMDFFTSDSAFDTSRARRMLGWAPRVELARACAGHRGLPAVGRAELACAQDLSRVSTITESSTSIGRCTWLEPSPGNCSSFAGRSRSGRPWTPCWVTCRRSRAGCAWSWAAAPGSPRTSCGSGAAPG